MSPSLTTLRTQIGQALLDYSVQSPHIVGMLDYGSSSEGRADALSDLDIALFIRDEALFEFEQHWKTWAAQFGSVLLAYIGGFGYPWVVYDAEPLPLRVDVAFQRASELDTVLAWPNAPSSVDAMLLYDKTNGQLASYVKQLVGQSLAPTDRKQSFESSCGDFWYYSCAAGQSCYVANSGQHAMILTIWCWVFWWDYCALRRMRLSAGALALAPQ